MPEPRRVLVASHGDRHAARRHLHARLPLLRGEPRPADDGRSRRAATRRGGGGAARPPARRDDLGQPRRSARRRRRSFRGDRARAVTGAGPGVHDRGPDPRFPGGSRGARDRRRGADRDPEPQYRDRAAALQARAARGHATNVRSAILAAAKRLRPGLRTKTGLMLGLGETAREVIAVLVDVRAIGCDVLTLGQYLRPGHGGAAGRALRYPGGVRRARSGGACARIRLCRVGSARAQLVSRLATSSISQNISHRDIGNLEKIDEKSREPELRTRAVCHKVARFQGRRMDGPNTVGARCANVETL